MAKQEDVAEEIIDKEDEPNEIIPEEPPIVPTIEVKSLSREEMETIFQKLVGDRGGPMGSDLQTMITGANSNLPQSAENTVQDIYETTKEMASENGLRAVLILHDGSNVHNLLFDVSDATAIGLLQIAINCLQMHCRQPSIERMSNES